MNSHRDTVEVDRHSPIQRPQYERRLRAAAEFGRLARQGHGDAVVGQVER